MSADARVQRASDIASHESSRHLRGNFVEACAYSETFEGAWAWRRFRAMLEHRQVPGHARRERESQERFDEEALAAEIAAAQSAADEDELEDMCWDEHSHDCGFSDGE
jgi:hypothetical protein